MAWPPQAHLVMDDFTAIAAAAVSGLGIAWIPDWLAAQEVEQERLRCILPQSAGVTFPIAAFWPEAPWVAQKIRVTIDALLAGLPQAIRQTGGQQ